jgi:molecular chaperone GrpE
MLKRTKDIESGERESLTSSEDRSETKATAVEGEDSGARPEAVESAPGTPSEIDKLQAQIAAKDQEIAELKDKYLRGLAEFENARRRLRQQSEETVRLQRENFLRELLPIVDNLERALEAGRGGGNGKPIVEGVELVLRSMLEFLKSQGVAQMPAVGHPFDPQRHEAVDLVTSAEHPPNTVVTEFNRGYQVGDRVLRPARVSVAKAPGEPGNDNDGNAGGTGVENC